MRVAINIAMVLVWLCVLTIGFNVDSKMCFDVLEWNRPIYSIGNLVLGGLAFTPSNVALLSVLSVAIGYELTRDPEDEISESLRIAVLGGAVVFFAVFFGGSWLDKEKFIRASQEDYFTIASACIALGLAAGVNPGRVRALISGSEEE